MTNDDKIYRTMAIVILVMAVLIPVAAFAEDYRVDVIPGGCRLTWTMVQKPARGAGLGMAVFGPLLNLALRRFLRNLRTYTDTRFAATQQR